MKRKVHITRHQINLHDEVAVSQCHSIPETSLEQRPTRFSLRPIAARLALGAAWILLLSTLDPQSATTYAQGTTFTYQGRLMDGANPANGSFDLRFALLASEGGGSPLAGPLTNALTPVVDGLFTVTIDFGAAAFSGADRWLEMGVRPSGGGTFTTLTPRHKITPTPYSVRAAILSAGGLSAGSYASIVAFNNPANEFTGIHAGDGSRLRGIHSLDASDGAPTNAVFVNDLGSVGIGTTSPVSPLQVNGSVVVRGPAVTTVSSAVNTNLLNLVSGNTTNGYINGISFYEGGTFSAAMSLGYDGSGNSLENALRIYHSSGNPLFTFEASGQLGIGTNKPAAPLHVTGIMHSDTQLSVGSTVQLRASESGTDGADLLLQDAAGLTTINLDAEQSGGGSALTMANGNGVMTVIIDADQTDAASMSLFKADGSEGIILDADNAVGGSLVSAQIMRITGGADIAEPFEISGDGLQPGMVVSIDAERPGQLELSRTRHDRKVAGIVSGAGGVQTGLMLAQKGSIANGTHPVALTGRVYCWCDATNGKIEPGDLLTTSDVPGHAMKVTQVSRAQGAILGKAMSSLERGRGLVLVLVNLQ